ncbi:epoxide hydrolase [Brachybacterium halotolerans subsp. kimchii]|uniref:epoxide hydrolase family protein n=1 Tax=Brachybacterium halotolerans TaxID=2795215 RepID=UPI001E305E93|nr:epoxide hydrolase family protein [Brachybacterium halotolerans]UEJ81441.1 epoxide hydrolase [Brachybacterium halotolerans subsp. kimchii]
MTDTTRDIRELRVETPESDLEDLRARLASTRLPEPETVRPSGPGPQRWAQGVPLADLTELIAHWRTDYEWRAFEARLHEIGQQVTRIDGLDIAFLHRRSSRPDATPVVMTHGWPGSIAEFVDVVDALAEPSDPNAPAFHVVAPSLPGFGFSGKPDSTGWGIEKIAAAWVELMERLGYPRFLAHGGDWGGVITTVLGGRFPQQVIGIHTLVAQPPPGLSTAALAPDERAMVERSQTFWARRAAYAKVQASSPQTIGYSLVDSPVGLLAWILEKFAEWTDTWDTPFETISRDRILDNVTLYWLTRTGASAARIYAESHDSLDPALRVGVPTAVTVHPHDIETWPRVWARERFRDIVRWHEPESGGHFPSLEMPEAFLEDVRAGLAAVSR